MRRRFISVNLERSLRQKFKKVVSARWLVVILRSMLVFWSISSSNFLRLFFFLYLLDLDFSGLCRNIVTENLLIRPVDE